MVVLSYQLGLHAFGYEQFNTLTRKIVRIQVCIIPGYYYRL